jgi:hypothetical protein
MASDKQWKAIWNIRAPGKMKIHLWRFAHDCLPSSIHLRKRQVPETGPCVFCGRTEGIDHALLTCQFARIVWREVKQHVHLQLNRKYFATTRQWLFDFLDRANELQATTLAVCFWHIWEAQNDARNSSEKPNPTRTCGKIFAYIDLIKDNLFKKPSASRCESSTLVPRRTPPPPGVVLVNSDATIFEAMGSMGAGIVVRDHLGVCLVACRQQLQGLTPPENAEALALRQAVLLARDEGFDKVIFATDCLPLAQRLNATVTDRSSVGLLVSGIKAIATSFTSVPYIHVKQRTS